MRCEMCEIDDGVANLDGLCPYCFIRRAAIMNEIAEGNGCPPVLQTEGIEEDLGILKAIGDYNRQKML